LKALSKNKASALSNFTKFFQTGLTIKESIIISSFKRMIRDHYKNLFDIDFERDDTWKKFSEFDKVTKSHIFYPSKITNIIKLQYKYLSLMSRTQLFMEFLQKEQDLSLKIQTNINSARLIADWLFFRWKYVNRHSLKKI